MYVSQMRCSKKADFPQRTHRLSGCVRQSDSPLSCRSVGAKCDTGNCSWHPEGRRSVREAVLLAALRASSLWHRNLRKYGLNQSHTTLALTSLFTATCFSSMSRHVTFYKR